MPTFFHRCLFISALALLNAPLAFAEVRILSFPQDVSCGRIYGKPTHRIEGNKDKFAIKDIFLGTAQGKVTVPVKPEYTIWFEPSRRVYEHPELLEKIDLPGIDGIRLKFTSMTNREDNLCNKVLSKLSHFKSIKHLDANYSDVSDAGLQELGSLPNLDYLDVSNTFVTAKSLPVIGSCHSLQTISMGNTNLQGANFAALANLHKLNLMDLHHTMLSSSDLKGMASCKSIKDLDIHNNPKVDESCLSYISGLNHLAVISLAGTAIHGKSLVGLVGCPLREVRIDDTHCDAGEADLLRKTFPRIVIYAENAKAHRKTDAATDHDARAIFSPLR
jgi:hypothetical protein